MNEESVESQQSIFPREHITNNLKVTLIRKGDT